MRRARSCDRPGRLRVVVLGAVLLGPVLALALPGCGARAQTAPTQAAPEALPQGGASPGSADTILTDKPKLRAFCADRPTQATLACTVDAGHFQLETDLFDVTYDRSGGEITDTFLFTNPTLKLGLANRTDIEVNLAPYEEVRTHDPSTGGSHALYGPGDLTIGVKQNLIGDYHGPLAIAVLPLLKAPTARAGIGNGAWEGGVIVPVAAAVTKNITLNLSPELDVRKDMVGGGVHLEPVEIINLAWSLPANFTLSTELFARERQDPAGVTTQCSADLALALGLPNDLQLDIGANLGLNPQTAAAEGYMGVAKRF